jgi:(R,R)-butanediol dehydrogenase / meso-butanediol dehydrogenase / diacetyl reductase
VAQARPGNAGDIGGDDHVKAVVCVPGGAEVAELPHPRPVPGEVIVEVDACGMCGSDVHAVADGLTRPGQVLGHEFSGRIAETGKGVTGWQAGQAVAVNPLGSCRACRACGRGVPFRCEAVPNLGITAPGGYAEYVAVPQGQLVALPDGLPVEMGAHAEPLAVALQAVALAGPGPGDAALVYGVGTIGLNVIMCLRLAGVQLIVAAGRSPGRRAAAAALGADAVIDTRELSVSEYARRADRRFAAVLECSGATGSAGEALGVLEPGGTCVQVGLTGESAAVPLGRLVGDGLRLAGSCAFSYPTYQAAVGHIASGRVPAAGLISERVGLDCAPAALKRLQNPGDLVRVLVRPDRAQ